MFWFYDFHFLSVAHLIGGVLKHISFSESLQFDMTQKLHVFTISFFSDSHMIRFPGLISTPLSTKDGCRTFEACYSIAEPHKTVMTMTLSMLF